MSAPRRPVRPIDLDPRPAPGVCLYCPGCGDTWSATAGDYFMRDPDAPMRCASCRRLLVLARRRTVYELLVESVTDAHGSTTVRAITATPTAEKETDQ